jgi:hypothetical protein
MPLWSFTSDHLTGKENEDLLLIKSRTCTLSLKLMVFWSITASRVAFLAHQSLLNDRWDGNVMSRILGLHNTRLPSSTVPDLALI